MRFPYTKIPGAPNKPWKSRPHVPIRLYGPKGSIQVSALVDSGADLCYFDQGLGEIIGLDITSGTAGEVMGIEGKRMPVYMHTIRLSVDGMPGDIELTAGFTPSKGVSALLGQEGFFDAFRIIFERHKGIIDISRIGKL